MPEQRRKAATARLSSAVLAWCAAIVPGVSAGAADPATRIAVFGDEPTALWHPPGMLAFAPSGASPR